MKVKDGFVVREVAGEWVAVAVGTRTAEFPGVIALSETAAFVWKLLEQGSSQEEVLERLTSEFIVDRKKAERDLKGFLRNLSEKGLLENE